jgi:hypothetical protein
MSYVPSKTVLTSVVHEASFTAMTKAPFLPVSPHSCGLVVARAGALLPAADERKTAATAKTATAGS